jgi:glycosyltransferase involved in cell wall biosynthesis
MVRLASSRAQERGGTNNTARSQRRIVFDLTTNAIWSGKAVGIVRVEGEFAKWALGHLDNVIFAFFDPDARTFRQVNRDIIGQLLSEEEAFIDVVPPTDPRRKRKRKTDRIPAAIRPYALWVLQSRRMALQALERIRLTTTSAKIASAADRVQRAIINDKHSRMIKDDDSRRACIPIDIALGPPIEFRPDDLLICAGAGWVYNDIDRIATLRRNTDCRFVLICYDIIPLMFPHYFKELDVELLRVYFNAAFPIADLVVFISRTAEADTRSYCAAHGIPLRATAICSLGANAGAIAPAERLPVGLEPGRYALMVGTIEPRKGHRMVLTIWNDLLVSGIPQRARFKLAFAGREGGMVGDLMLDLRKTCEVTDSLQVVTDADDATLALLYRHAAFCLLPSRYEGFGLPAVEAFFHGKAVLASTGGALPEVVRDFSPCLDPDDAAEWRRKLKLWIENPAAREPYETRIRTSFRHPKWDEAAEKFFALVQNVGTDASRV